MDFGYSVRVEELRSALLGFMESHVHPAEAVYREQVEAQGDPHRSPPVMEEL
jgi:acyl-CoA dehydrogenase